MSELTDPAKAGQLAKSAPKRLGRGLGALLGEVKREEPLVRLSPGPAAERTASDEALADGAGPAPDGLAMLPDSAIVPHPDQPRRHFDEAALEELAASIAARGVIQPVIVRRQGSGQYQLVAGERRWRAAQKARLHEIPALVRDLAERDVLALALIENIQREDLNPIEEARAYHRLAQVEGLTQAEIAEIVDKSRSHVANFQRLLSLPEGVLELVETGQLSMGHARALVGHEGAEVLAREAVARGWSVRDMERQARKSGGEGKDKGRRTARAPGEAAQDADIAAVQNHLEEFLGMAVRINADADPRSGAVTIRYRTLDQLDMICQRLSGESI